MLLAKADLQQGSNGIAACASDGAATVGGCRNGRQTIGGDKVSAMWASWRRRCGRTLTKGARSQAPLGEVDPHFSDVLETYHHITNSQLVPNYFKTNFYIIVKDNS